MDGTKKSGPTISDIIADVKNLIDDLESASISLGQNAAKLSLVSWVDESKAVGVMAEADSSILGELKSAKRRLTVLLEEFRETNKIMSESI